MQSVEDLLDLTDDQINRGNYTDANDIRQTLPDFLKSILKAFCNYCACYANEGDPIDIAVVTDAFEFLSVDRRHFTWWKRTMFVSGMTGVQNLAYFQAQFGLRTPGCPHPPAPVGPGQNIGVQANAPPQGGVVPPGGGGGGGGGNAITPADRFRQSVKVTIQDYNIFKDIQDWDIIKRNYESKANFQGTIHVL